MDDGQLSQGIKARTLFPDLLDASEKNFEGNFARELFTPTDEVEARVDKLSKKIGDGITCSIHVRRGNYVNLQNKHVLLDFKYYLDAIYEMLAIGVKKFVVFSDDIEWCRSWFMRDDFLFIEDVDYIEMFLMGRCTHNIIANSSFSWWGAYLGDPDGRKVIAPSSWFPNPTPDASDIIPENWNKI